MVKEVALGTSGYAIASLITGVISLILGWIPILGWLVIFFTYLFAFLGLRDINKKKRKGKSLAVAGLVLAVFSTILAAIIVYATIVGYNLPRDTQLPTQDGQQGNALIEPTPQGPGAIPDEPGTPSSGAPTTTGTQPIQQKVRFSPGIINTYAILNEPLNYSFCDPLVLHPSDICNPGDRVVSNPRGGNPPYHFTIDHGFFHTGLILHPNGYLDGTPKTAGSITVDVCATDLSGNTACEPDTLEVVDMAVTLDSARCSFKSCGSNGVCVWRLTLAGTARGPTSSWVTPMGSGVDTIDTFETFADPEMDYTCGTWTPHKYAASCTNPSGPGTTSYTFVYTVFSRSRSITLTPRVAMGINHKAEIRYTSDKTKTVTCP
jgi:hypothetical protein